MMSFTESAAYTAHILRDIILSKRTPAARWTLLRLRRDSRLAVPALDDAVALLDCTEASEECPNPHRP